jgi:hypothetical protein
MSRWTRPLFAIALLACASLAHADALRLLVPASGATLRGGAAFVQDARKAAFFVVAARASGGGRYYAFRVTPHLDIDVQRFAFIVPNVDTRNARILIRAGNERRETLFEFPATFTIARDAKAGAALPRLLDDGKGEAARDGDPDVIAWTSGARNGSGLAQQSPAPEPSRSFRRAAKAAAETALVVTPAGKQATIVSVERTRLTTYQPRATSSEQPARSVDLLLICRRRNV